MDPVAGLMAVLIIAASSGLLIWLTRRATLGAPVALRPLPGYDAIREQTGRAVESGRGVHASPGRASLGGRNNPASLAGLNILDALAGDACASDVPPLVTVGDGTLLVAAQDSLRGAYTAAIRPGGYSGRTVRFMAGDGFPFAFAAGVTHLLNDQQLASSVLAGHFGAEVALIGEAAARSGLEQIVASDDPQALAASLPMAGHVIVGEELFAAGAYLQADAAQLASLQVQDILRLFVAAAIVLAALANLIVGP
jgi:hypothetical protein